MAWFSLKKSKATPSTEPAMALPNGADSSALAPDALSLNTDFTLNPLNGDKQDFYLLGSSAKERSALEVSELSNLSQSSASLLGSAAGDKTSLEPDGLNLSSATDAEQELSTLSPFASVRDDLEAMQPEFTLQDASSFHGGPTGGSTNFIDLDANDSEFRSSRKDELATGSGAEQFASRLLSEKQRLDISLLTGEAITKRKNSKAEVLDDEDEGMETDFVTGNVTVVDSFLKTGTDGVASAGAASALAKYHESEEETTSSESGERIIEITASTGVFRAPVQVFGALSEYRLKLVPIVLHDMGIHWFTYSLAILTCCLALTKVYQVQETRDLTARLNEVQMHNKDLEKQWLDLEGERQKYSEHAKIRNYASERLNMAPPKTDAEEVIYLNR